MIIDILSAARTGVAKRDAGLLLPTLIRLDAAGGEFAVGRRRLEGLGAGDGENVAIVFWFWSKELLDASLTIKTQTRLRLSASSSHAGHRKLWK